MCNAITDSIQLLFFLSFSFLYIFFFFFFYILLLICFFNLK